MSPQVETATPDNVMKPLGPYSHIATSGDLIMISATAGVDPQTNELAGPDVASQTHQILRSFSEMLDSAQSDFAHVLHVNVFLTDMADFAEMNAAYAEAMGSCKPARSAVAVRELPRPGARVTMNLTAVKAEA